MSEPSLNEVFRQEADELMEQLELALLDLERSPQDQPLIDLTFRALHTIKGSSAMFGYEQVAAFIHDFETAFDRIRKGLSRTTPPLIKAALEAKDYIRLLIDTPEKADPAKGSRILALLAAATSSGIEAAPAAAAVAAAAAPASVGGSWRLAFGFDRNLLVNGSNPALMFDEMRALGSCELVADWSAVPSIEAFDAQGLYLTWTATLTSEQPVSALDDVFIFVRDDMKLDITPLDAPAAPAAAAPPPPPTPPTAAAAPAMTASVPAPAPAAPAVEASATPRAKDSATIRVPAERLDAMMDRIGELVIVQARLSQLTGGAGEALASVAEDIERLTSALREAMMGIRMVPIGSLFVRFRRLLHDLSRDLGKEIELVTVGDETEMDKTMIERLADPLVHIIRNSADHGLEIPATRTAAGKSPVGRIELVARHAGGEVLLSIRDDGRGLDARRIRQKAEEQGLIQPGETIADSDLYPMIFAPGFSTANEVSALSGRGVGMDVVKRTIEAMRGSIDIATAAGQGTTITLRLPLTLAIIEGLLVRVADTRYVIPLTAVEECVELTQTEDTRSEGRSFLNIRGDLIAFLRLRELFGDEGKPDPHQKVVIVANGEGRVGLVVDQIIGSHQTVIKSLSPLHADVVTFSGATILGDGAVALILDTQHVVTLGQSLESRHKASQMEMAS